MAIGGGIKFFGKSLVLAKDGGTIAASTGNTESANAIDTNPLSYWRSSGSSDATTETLTLTFASTALTRILLLDHNFKDFNIQYWTGAAWAHLATVVGLDGSKTNITETVFADDTAYYEFASVTTTQLRIQVLKTQVANAEKYVSQIIATTELGTLTGYPVIKNLVLSRNQRSKVMLSGKKLITKGIDSFSVKIDFDKYPARLFADLDLAFTLFDREDPFLVWLCGGRRGSTYFKYTLRGFRLKDVYQVQVDKDYGPEYVRSVYLNHVGLELTLVEHV